MTERLNDLSEQEIDDILRDYESVSGKQIRYVPKIHRPVPAGVPLLVSVEPVEKSVEMKRAQTKSREIADFVTEELRQYRAGETDHLMTSAELASMFEYKSHRIVNKVLRKLLPETILQERLTILRPRVKEVEVPIPSMDLAWLLGGLCGAGSVDLKKRHVVFSTVEGEFSDRFRALSENVFKLNPSLSSREDPRGTRPRFSIAFNRIDLAEFIGIISKVAWPDTIRQKHQWIFENINYISAFLSGFFDGRGEVQLPRRDKYRTGGGGIMFVTFYENVAVFLTELLSAIDIENIRIARNKRDGRVYGVRIGNYRDIVKFAKLVRSTIPKKEEGLAFYRDFQPVIVRSSQVSNDQLVGEYARVREITVRESGRLPTQNDIRTLRQRGVVKFSVGAYINHFGMGVSFAKARAELEEVLGSQQERN